MITTQSFFPSVEHLQYVGLASLAIMVIWLASGSLRIRENRASKPELIAYKWIGAVIILAHIALILFTALLTLTPRNPDMGIMALALILTTIMWIKDFSIVLDALNTTNHSHRNSTEEHT